MEILGVRAVEGVELQDDLLGQSCCRWRDAACGGEVDVVVVAHLFDVADLQYGPVNVAVEAVSQFLCHVAQM